MKSRMFNLLSTLFLGTFKFANSESIRERSARLATLSGQRYSLLILSTLLVTICSPPLRAQVGDNNPTGVAGIFNGNITTGCSYDPYTGNATRTVTDIVVAAAVGEYGLSLSRTFSSRNGWGLDFGIAGGWHHNYNWVIEDSAPSQTSGFQPSSYTVDFPDGRTETFVYSASDPGYYRAAAGVRDRLQPLNLGTMLAYLILPDGGKIEFKATQQSYRDDCCPLDGCGQCTFYYYSYVAQAIIDPHGLRTSLTYNADGTLNKVTDPAGRYLQFYWLQVTGYKVIDHVTASDGRTVQYSYVTISPGGTPYTALDHIVYFGNSSWTARYQYRAPNVGAAYGLPLLWTADDPMYAGPMHKIAYTYKTGTNPDNSAAVFGQIQSENYYDGTTIGVAVSTLSVTGTYTRTETRADGKTRTFNYQSGGYLTSCTDFYAHSASQAYDGNMYINAVTDRNGNITNYTSDAITGLVTQIQYPLTVEDTPGQSIRPTVNYTYTNKYYLHTSQDEGGHTTTYTRDGNNRVTRIDYPDTGYETFSYDAAHFYQHSTHRMTTGGTETFSYDTSHRLQYYSDPYHSNPSNPNLQYSYDALNRVAGVTEVPLTTHTTNFDYNDRGQTTTTTLPWCNGVRYTIVKAYNPDGTLQMITNELGHHTTYTYDDYRRVRSVTPPIRGFNDNGSYVTRSYYDASGTGEDYRYTDSNVTFVVLPSGKKTKTVYDNNRRKNTVTVGYLSGDDATTTYIYDNAGNLTQVKNPRNYATTTGYDKRNRPSSVTDALNRMTSFTYDTAGHKKTITRPNGQVITYVTFDEMNRVLQQNVTQTPTGLATTKFTYYTSGLLNTMQDPHLSSGSDNYTYAYDLMGRNQRVTYPLDSFGAHPTEQWTYDTDGRLYQCTNRGGYIQTFSYDQLNRVSGFAWNDGVTPSVTFGYDATSRPTNINNVNANITRAYYNDNLLYSDTESILSGGYSKTVTYTYDSDGNRSNTTYPTPESWGFGYSYNGRNQLGAVNGWATYNYDESGYIGDLTSRVLIATQNTSTYLYDPLDRVSWLTHTISPNSRGFNYGYQTNTNNVKYVERTGALGNAGDVFNYDLADQVTGVDLNVSSPNTTPTPAPNITYDANGNRTSFHPPYVSWQTYGAANDLSQYTTRTILGTQATAAYDHKGNLTVGLDGSSYTYDAQNRLTNAPSTTIKYDGLNRQVSRTISGTTTYSVWDGWNLIEEYQPGSNATTAAYVYGATGLISGATNGYFAYYFQDANGSTSHVTDASGNLLEWYRYDLQGTPVFYNNSDHQITASAYGVCYLFTGQQWRTEIGLYDLRNRFYSPDIGRFLQPDPIGFNGDATNLYRYCGNNPVTRSDPNGEFWPILIPIVAGTLYFIYVWEDFYLTAHGPDMENPHEEEDNKPDAIPPNQQNRQRRPDKWGGGIPEREAEYWTGPETGTERGDVPERVPNDPGSYGLTVMGSGGIPILQGDSYFVSSGGPGILSPPGGIPIGPLGGSGGDLGNFGGAIGASYLRHLMKGIYTSPYLYGEEKGLWGGITGKMGPWQQQWPSWQSLHATEVYWGNVFRERGYIFAPQSGEGWRGTGGGPGMAGGAAGLRHAGINPKPF